MLLSLTVMFKLHQIAEFIEAVVIITIYLMAWFSARWSLINSFYLALSCAVYLSASSAPVYSVVRPLCAWLA